MEQYNQRLQCYTFEGGIELHELDEFYHLDEQRELQRTPPSRLPGRAEGTPNLQKVAADTN